MSEEERQVLAGEEGRCSSCGEAILGSERELVLRNVVFPADPLFFHEAEECSEPVLQLAEAYPEEWSCALLVPDAFDLPPLPPTPDVCGLCGYRLVPSEPDVLLLHTEVEEQTHRFHERCALPAYQLVEDDPRTWGLIHRLVDSDAN
jgi:hypothetical protein